MRRLSDIVYNQRPLTMPSAARVEEACRTMHERGVGSVLVTDEAGRLAGIFTGRDVVHRVVSSGRDPRETALAEVMTPTPVVMTPRESAIDALRLMWDGGFRHVPVLDGERVLGVVSRGDFTGSENERLDEERELWEHMR